MLFSQFLLAPLKEILLLTDDFSLTIITFNRSDVGGKRVDLLWLYYFTLSVTTLFKECYLKLRYLARVVHGVCISKNVSGDPTHQLTCPLLL